MSYSPWGHKELGTTEQLSTHVQVVNTHSADLEVTAYSDHYILDAMLDILLHHI